MEKSYIVTKSNKLITCNYELSLQEQKIILTLASMVQPQDTEFKEYEFKIKDFIELLGIKDQSKYTELPKITKELKKKVFDIEEGTDLIQVSWLGGVRYKRKEGILILSLDKGLKPYMLQLKELYTSYRLENVLSLKSKYSIRIYEILKSNSFKKNIEIKLEDFKNMIGAKEKAYNTYANVKNRIIIQAQKELELKTDINFDYEEIKTGRKVTSIKFIIRQNKTSKNEIAITSEGDSKEIQGQQTIEDINNINIVKSIIDNINDDGAMAILKVAGGDVEKIKDKYSIISKFKKVTNLTGAMIQAIKEDWTSQEINNNSFNNFEPRQYDYDSLEKKLLGWED
jgi:plasmid replication initiation protein